MNTIYEVDFIAPCPAQTCKHGRKAFRWKHHNCGGYEKITSEGKIRCTRCGTSGLFVDWNFECQNHSFKPASSQGIANALSVMTQLVVKPEEIGFIALLMVKIANQFLNKK